MAVKDADDCVQVIRVPAGVRTEEATGMSAGYMMPTERDLFLFDDVRAGYFRQLDDFLILLYFIPTAKVRRGRAVYGEAKKASKREREFFSIDGWVELAADVWEDMTDDEKDALIFRALKHFRVEGGELKMQDPDVSFFIGEVERWGVEQPAVQAILRTLPELRPQRSEEDTGDDEADDAEDILDA